MISYFSSSNTEAHMFGLGNLYIKKSRTNMVGIFKCFWFYKHKLRYNQVGSQGCNSVNALLQNFPCIFPTLWPLPVSCELWNHSPEISADNVIPCIAQLLIFPLHSEKDQSDFTKLFNVQNQKLSWIMLWTLKHFPSNFVLLCLQALTRLNLLHTIHLSIWRSATIQL